MLALCSYYCMKNQNSPYLELVCNRPDYLASYFSYPDWLNQPDSEPFKAHAKAYAEAQTK